MRVLLMRNLWRKFFVQLRELRDGIESEFQVKLPHISMGMTNDFAIAKTVAIGRVRTWDAHHSVIKSASPMMIL